MASQSDSDLAFEIDETHAIINDLKCLLELSDEDCLRDFLDLQNDLDAILQDKMAWSCYGIQKHDVSTWNFDLNTLMDSCIDLGVTSSQMPVFEFVPVHGIEFLLNEDSDFELGLHDGMNILYDQSYGGPGSEPYCHFLKYESPGVIEQAVSDSSAYFSVSTLEAAGTTYPVLSFTRCNFFAAVAYNGECKFIEIVQLNEKFGFPVRATFCYPQFYRQFLYMQVCFDSSGALYLLFTYWTDERPGMGPHFARFDDRGECMDVTECELLPQLFHIHENVATFKVDGDASEHPQTIINQTQIK